MGNNGNTEFGMPFKMACEDIEKLEKKCTDLKAKVADPPIYELLLNPDDNNDVFHIVVDAEPQKVKELVKEYVDSCEVSYDTDGLIAFINNKGIVAGRVSIKGRIPF